MNTFLNKFKLLVTKFLYLFPSRTPIGMTEFQNWSTSILRTYGWPENDSFRFSLAAMVINLGPTVKYRSKYWFGVSLHSAASKQIAGEVFRVLKDKQLAEAKAAKLAEATALSVVANEQPG